MIDANRSFEHRGYATRRTHLMPVEPFPGNRTIRGFYVPWWAWGTLFLLAGLVAGASQ